MRQKKRNIFGNLLKIQRKTEQSNKTSCSSIQIIENTTDCILFIKQRITEHLSASLVLTANCKSTKTESKVSTSYCLKIAFKNIFAYQSKTRVCDECAMGESTRRVHVLESTKNLIIQLAKTGPALHITDLNVHEEISLFDEGWSFQALTEYLPSTGRNYGKNYGAGGHYVSWILIVKTIKGLGTEYRMII